jgi:type I restriction-modification system DNA methylase subunit
MSGVKRAAIYVRCSTVEQETDLQETELREYAAKRGWECVLYRDKGQSGAKNDRPALNQMLADLRKRKFDVIVVWALDRLARSLKQLLTIAEAGAQSRFNNPVNLKKLLGVIDETEWTALDIDIKAAAFEGLLEKAASEGKKGAGQYFTPRILIKAIVGCMKPDPRTHSEFTICDPACGTGGFLVSS